MKRNTWQSERIQEELDKIDTFFTAEDLHEKLKEDNIGIATIYRFLKEKKDKSIFQYTCNRKQTFSKENRSHCHFTCEKTGKVTHFNIDSLDFLKNKIPGSIKSFQLEVRGVCDYCSEKDYTNL
jgi:Fe2+ or Zn2+ uptake regulation protein